MSRWTSSALLWFGIFCAAVAARAENAPPVDAGATPSAVLARDDEIRELKRQVSVLVDEVSTLRNEMGVPEQRPLESAYGLGPAASKVYGAAQGLSIGGYAEAVYRNAVGDTAGGGRDEADFVRMVLYVGHKFTDSLLFNTELEFEHASTGESGSVSVEFATLDWLHSDELNFRGGLLLVPMGFVNEIHEPPFYYGTQRPEAERSIIPSTWREMGAGIFGQFGEMIEYRAYVVSGFDATGFSSSGLRGGRQKGSEAMSTDLAFVARVDVTPTPSLLFGGSFYQGQADQEQTFSTTGRRLPDVNVRIWEMHGEYFCGPFHTRGLLTYASVSDAGPLSFALGLANDKPVANEMLGGYVEAGYDLLSILFPGSEKSLVAFFRFEYLDTQHDVPSDFMRDRTRPRRLFIPGIHFKPHPNVVLKLDYRNVDVWSGNAADVVSAGFGLVF